MLTLDRAWIAQLRRICIAATVHLQQPPGIARVSGQLQDSAPHRPDRVRERRIMSIGRSCLTGLLGLFVAGLAAAGEAAQLPVD